jgi:Flp pilus assembly protein TadG
MSCHPERPGPPASRFCLLGWGSEGPAVLPIIKQTMIKHLMKRKLNRIARQLANTNGSEIAEAALVLPVVFMLLLGIIWFGRAFNIYSTIQQAAQQGAITAARATCATCPPPAFPAATAVATAVTAVMQASSIDPSQIVNPGPTLPTGCASSSNITVCQEVLLNPSSNPTTIQSCGSPPAPSPTQFCGALVTFQYPFQFNLPFTSLNLQQIILTAQAQSRMEN